MSVTLNPVNWSANTKKNTSTAATIAVAGIGAKAITNTTKGKSYKWNRAINNPLKKFAKSEKNFFGSDLLKNIAGKLSKTSARQKLLGFLAIDTLGAVMLLREHFSKENGKDIQRKKDNNIFKTQKKQIEARDNYIEKQNEHIANIEADLMIKDSEIKSYNKTLEAIDKAAQKLGVDKNLAKELTNQS